MGGIFGVTLRKDCECINTLFYGVDYNSHLGTRRAGMATVCNEKFARSIHNIENTYFRTKFEHDLDQFSGSAGIGVISDTDAQPIIFNSKLGRFAIVSVAKIVNINQLQQQLLDKGHHFCEHSNDVVNPTELIATLISDGNSFVDGIRRMQAAVKGSCTVLILKEDGTLIAARDRLGRTPLIIGNSNDGYGVTSESCAFPNLGFTDCYELGPAEIVHITPGGITQLAAPGNEMQVCAFLWTYYGYPPCNYEGRNVDEMRWTDGYEVAKDDDVDIDFVSPIPDSGTGMALGYAAGRGKPFLRGISKYTPTWPRSFTPDNQKRRELVAKMKLIPNYALLNGKNVAFCDDSIVRGTQLRDNVKDMRNAGVNSVHVRISCPPLVYPCEYLNFTASKSELELITRRVIHEFEGENITEEVLKRYTDASTPEYARMVERIRELLGLDSLRFASLDTLVNAIGLPKCRICTHCFDGTSHF